MNSYGQQYQYDRLVGSTYWRDGSVAAQSVCRELNQFRRIMLNRQERCLFTERIIEILGGLLECWNNDQESDRFANARWMPVKLHNQVLRVVEGYQKEDWEDQNTGRVKTTIERYLGG